MGCRRRWRGKRNADADGVAHELRDRYAHAHADADEGVAVAVARAWRVCNGAIAVQGVRTRELDDRLHEHR